MTKFFWKYNFSMNQNFLQQYLQKLKKSGIERKIPNISEENAHFIGKVLCDKNPKNILEIGTANGFSALSFHYELLKNTKNPDKIANIFTIEYAWNAHIEATEHFKNCKIKNIFPIWGDAKKILPSLADQFFDVIYVDAMKKEYLDYFLLSLSKAKKDAIFIIDDVEKFAHKMQNFYSFLHEKNIAYQLEKTDLDDSIMIIERKNITL